MTFSRFFNVRITKNFTFILAFMCINAVAVGTIRSRANSAFLAPSQITHGAFTFSQNLDALAEPTQDPHSTGPIYNSNSSRRDSLSATDATFIQTKKIFRRDVSRAGANSTRAEYYLGYSSNVFESYTNYIKQVSPEYYTPSDIPDQRRRKRSVLHLYNMVLCATGCNPLSYKGYGCYCGFLGSGYAVDGIDRCCKMHDWCYDTAGCPMFLEYFIPYLWKCYRHQYPLCAIDHGEFGGPGSCAQKLCECDRRLAQCLRMYPCPSSKALCTSSPWRLLQNLLTN